MSNFIVVLCFVDVSVPVSYDAEHSHSQPQNERVFCPVYLNVDNIVSVHEAYFGAQQDDPYIVISTLNEGAFYSKQTAEQFLHALGAKV